MTEQAKRYDSKRFGDNEYSKKRRDNRAISAREITTTAIFAAVTAVCAQIAIPMPFTPIPISCGMIGIYATGMLLKPGHAILAQVCYLLLGAAGAPVFGSFRGGIAALFGPTGGCLMVYPVMAAIISITLNSAISLQAEKRQGKAVLYAKTSAAICVALCIEYLGGAAWLAATAPSSYYAALTMIGFPLYVPLDILKIVFSVVAFLPFRARLMSANIILRANEQ